MLSIEPSFWKGFLGAIAGLLALGLVLLVLGGVVLTYARVANINAFIENLQRQNQQQQARPPAAPATP